MRLSDKSIAVAIGGVPYLALVDLLSGRIEVSWGSAPNNAAYSCAVSSDGILALGYASSPYIKRYNMSDWTLLSNPATLPGNLVYGCAFSPDASLLAASHFATPYITIYNTSDWSKVANPSTLPAGIGYGCAFSPNGSLLAVAHANSPYVTIYNTSDWSKVSNPGTLPSAIGRGCAFSPNGSLLAVAHNNSPYITIYNTSDWSKIANPSTLPTNTALSCAFSPDGTKLAVGHIGSPYLRVYNTTSWEALTVDTITNVIGITQINSVLWRSNTQLLCSTNGSPGIVEYDITTGSVIDVIYSPASVNCMALLPAAQYEINGIIDETLAASNWTAEAHEIDSGVLVGRVEFSGTIFTIPLTTTTPVLVTINADQGTVWQPDTVYALHDKVFPSDPITTPYYYKRIAAGTSGATEPTWLTTPGAQVDDGAVTTAWELVERLIQPITHGPLIPS